MALLRWAKSCRPQISFIGPARRNEPAKDIRLRSLGETFLAYCFKPVTGLIVSLAFTSATAPTASPWNREGDLSISLFPRSGRMRVYTTRIFTYLVAKTIFACGLRWILKNPNGISHSRPVQPELRRVMNAGF